MTVRIHNLAKWQVLPAGSVLQFRGPEYEGYTPEHRRIVVEVNCEAPTSWKVIEGPRDKEPKITFLAVVQGLEKLEFTASADAELVPSGDGEVWYFTSDGDNYAHDQVNADGALAVSFTSVMQRRTRNRQLELIAWKTEQRQRQRDDAMRGEIAAFKADFIAKHGFDPETGETADGDGQAAAAGAVSGDQGAAAVAAPAVAPAAGVAGTAPAVKA